MEPALIVPAFDAYLEARGLSFEAVVIGGAALVLLGVVQRATEDCDVLDPHIPEPVLVAARAFAREQRISDDWLNEGNAESRDMYWLPLARRQLARLGKELGYDAVF